jgi:hypothetical protein
MRTLITMLVLLAGACTGSAPASVDSGRTCNGTNYDRCLQEHDCMSGDCRNFPAPDNFQVCSKTCTVGDDTTCGMTLDGRPATCVAGLCKPPGPNECILVR